MTNDQPVWHLHGSIAQLTSARLAATIDVQQSGHGLVSLTSEAADVAFPIEGARVLGVNGGRATTDSVHPTDTYVRGDDLILTGQFSGAPEVGLQVYWRVLQDEAHGVMGVEAIVSAQTELLDSDPASTVTSRWPRGTVLVAASGGEPKFVPLSLMPHASAEGRGVVLIRPDNAPISFLEMVHPADDRGATIESSDEYLVTRYPVLTERLEKGVIRRSRLRAMFLPREHDAAIAEKLFQRFASSEVPLTT